MFAKKKSDQRSWDTADVYHRSDVRKTIGLLRGVEIAGIEARFMDKGFLSDRGRNEALVQSCGVYQLESSIKLD